MKRLLMLTSVATMVAMATPAYADPPFSADADFIAQLKDAGLTEEDPAAAVTLAKDMCSLIDTGASDTVIQSNLVSRNPGLTAHDATEFMTLAKGKYCSKYLTGGGQPPKPPGAQGN
jgi:hypothetical protein